MLANFLFVAYFWRYFRGSDNKENFICKFFSNFSSFCCFRLFFSFVSYKRVKKNNEAKKCLFFLQTKLEMFWNLIQNFFFLSNLIFINFLFFVCQSVIWVVTFLSNRQSVFCYYITIAFSFFSYLFLRYNNAVLEEKTLNFRLNLCVKLFRFECKCRI